MRANNQRVGLCDTFVVGDFHKGLSSAAPKRQFVLNHLEKFAVLKFILRRNEQLAAFDDGMQRLFRWQSGDSLGIFGG